MSPAFQVFYYFPLKPGIPAVRPVKNPDGFKSNHERHQLVVGGPISLGSQTPHK
jgi:hypothetical protein